MSDNAPEVAPDAEAPVVSAVSTATPSRPRPARKKASAASQQPEPREAKVDKSYVERPYSEAMTSQQKAALEAEGLL